MTRGKLVKHRFESKLSEFHKNSLFCDCILTDNRTRIPAHRIQLARVCAWFERYFIANPPHPGEPQLVPIDVNPSGALEPFLQLVYTGECDLTLSNIIPLLKLAVYYEAPAIATILRFFLDRIISEETILSITDELLKNNLTDDALQRAPLLAKLFLAIVRPVDPTNRPPISISEFYAALSPRVFAGILQHCGKHLTDDEKSVTLMRSWAIAC
jgi:hypothetical protein